MRQLKQDYYLELIKKIYRKLRSFKRRFTESKLTQNPFYEKKELQKKDSKVLLALLRHDCHRLEKAYYNNYIDDIKKADSYQYIKDRAVSVLNVIKEKKEINDDPSLIWANDILNSYPDFDTIYKQRKKKGLTLNKLEGDKFLEHLKLRRSCRIWSSRQPDKNTLKIFSEKLIEAAISAPNTGNRQAWRFCVLIDEVDRHLFKIIKEKHCYEAPLMIFVGMDSRFYEHAGDMDHAMYHDAGAALMQIVNTGHFYGFGTCWNYLAQGQVTSRPQNVEAYENFVKTFNIPDYIIPSGIVSIGLIDEIPPTPDRMPVADLLIKKPT